MLYFFLEYTGELHIFVLRRMKSQSLTNTTSHSRLSCEGLGYVKKEL
jgi:hypothetical protein